MPIQGPIDQGAIARKQAGRYHIDPLAFAIAQEAMMVAGDPADPCGRCGCRRDGHLPKPAFSYAKSGGSSGKSIELPVLAPTSCDCEHCICSCVAWVEPYYGQPHWRCVYEPVTGEEA